jgi:hypothetical protein
VSVMCFSKASSVNPAHVHAYDTVYPRYNDGPGRTNSCRFNDLSLYEVPLLVHRVGLDAENGVVVTSVVITRVTCTTLRLCTAA